MFKIHEIREIIKLIDQSNISHFELENEGNKILIRKEIQETPIQPPTAAPSLPAQTQVPAVSEVPAAPKEAERPKPEAQPAEQQAAPPELDEEKFHKIVSPMVGTFYAAPSPGAKPYVSVGDHVEENTVVCIIEAMKLFNEIEAEVRGKIVKVLVENGQLVEYGQPLFLVQPE